MSDDLILLLNKLFKVFFAGKWTRNAKNKISSQSLK